MESENLKKYLKKIGFEDDVIEDILMFVTTEIDIKAFYEKIKYLADLNCNSRIIRIIIEENPLFLTTELSDIKNVVNYIKEKGLENYIINILEVNPDILSVPVEKIIKNEEILKILFSSKDIITFLRDRTEIFTFNNDYLADRIRLLAENGLKDKIGKIILTRPEIFDLEDDEINFNELKSNL